MHLPAADREFGAAVACYSIIHLDRDESETRRGYVLVRRSA
ncbi:hypothetical protein ABIA38_006680 [Embleya sp. AB8]